MSVSRTQNASWRRRSRRSSEIRAVCGKRATEATRIHRKRADLEALAKGLLGTRRGAARRSVICLGAQPNRESVLEPTNAAHLGGAAAGQPPRPRPDPMPG